jgi:hypothetical protein
MIAKFPKTSVTQTLSGNTRNVCTKDSKEGLRSSTGQESPMPPVTPRPEFTSTQRQSSIVFHLTRSSANHKSGRPIVETNDMSRVGMEVCESVHFHTGNWSPDLISLKRSSESRSNKRSFVCLFFATATLMQASMSLVIVWEYSQSLQPKEISVCARQLAVRAKAQGDASTHQS